MTMSASDYEVRQTSQDAAAATPEVPRAWIFYANPAQADAAWIRDLEPGGRTAWRQDGSAYARQMRVGDTVALLVGGRWKSGEPPQGQVVAIGVIAAPSRDRTRGGKILGHDWPVRWVHVFKSVPIERRQIEPDIDGKRERLIGVAGGVHPMKPVSLRLLNDLLPKHGFYEQIPLRGSIPNADTGPGDDATPPPSPPPQRDENAASPDLKFFDDDAEQDVDSLERGSLALVLARRLHVIWRNLNGAEAADRAPSRASFVMHLDAPWGGGKTTFANFVGRVLNPYAHGRPAPGFLTSRYPEGTNLGGVFAGEPTAAAEPELPPDERRPWIVVNYNAWQAEHCSPPWWAFYQVIRKACFSAIREEGSRPADLHRDASHRTEPWPVRLGRWLALLAGEGWWRLQAPRLVVPLVAFLIALAAFAAFSVLGRQQDDLSKAAKGLTAAFGVLAALAAVGSLLVATLVPGVDPLAEQLGLGRGDPLERFRRHFYATVRRVRRPVLVIVDDVDRCKPEVVVDLVRGMQTILKSPRVIFLILGDREWIESAFESVHAKTSVSVGPEQTLGARFVEKAIQMSFLLPGMDATRRTGYVDALLSPGARRSSAAEFREAVRKVLREAEAGAVFDPHELENEAITGEAGQAFLRQATDTDPAEAESQGPDLEAEARQVINEELAIHVASAREVEEETLRRLRPLASGLPPNPRQIKRILNGIALYHAAALQIPSFEFDEASWMQLALWVVIMTEWPATWRLLTACPELADLRREGAPLEAQQAKVRLPGSPAAIQEAFQRIRGDAELTLLLDWEGVGKPWALDTEAIRKLARLIPLHKPVRLREG